MTATAVRVIQLEKDKNRRLSEDSKEDIDMFFDQLASKGTKVGYVTRAFGQQNKLDYQMNKLKKQAKAKGLSTLTAGKAKNKQLIIYDAKKQSAVDSANNLIRTLNKTKNMSLPRVTKQESNKIKSMNSGLNSIKKKKAKISKQMPKKNNTTKTAKNKNIKGIKQNTEKRNLSKRPKI